MNRDRILVDLETRLEAVEQQCAFFEQRCASLEAAALQLFDMMQASLLEVKLLREQLEATE